MLLLRSSVLPAHLSHRRRLTLFADLLVHPSECTTESPGYQFIKASNQCKFLGSLSSEEWSLLEPSDPSAGVVVHYDNGAISSGCPRQLSYMMRCDKTAAGTANGGWGTISSVDATKDPQTQCSHYKVAWASSRACPASSGGNWGLIGFVLFGLMGALYFGGGIAYNMGVKKVSVRITLSLSLSLSSVTHPSPPTGRGCHPQLVLLASVPLQRQRGRALGHEHG